MLTIGRVVRARSGEVVSGDAIVVRQEPSRTLLAVVDALGHGHSAAEVATLAVAFLERAALDRGLHAVLLGLQEALRGSRGAAAMVCLLGEGKLVGCGIGNVELRTTSRDLPIVLSPGVVGGNVRRMQTFEGPLVSGDRLIFFTDGISSHLAVQSFRGLSPNAACEAILAAHRRSHDDAAVLVVDVGTP